MSGLHPQYLIERSRAIVSVTRDINAILSLLRNIEAINQQFDFYLELPGERAFLDALDALAAIYYKQGGCA